MERKVGDSGVVAETVLVPEIKKVIIHSAVAGRGLTTESVRSDADGGVNCWWVLAGGA